MGNPTVGRTVLYSLSETDSVRPEKVGTLRPALVVEDNGGSSSVNLKVSLDGSNDCPWSPCPDTIHRTSVSEGTEPGTWRWPTVIAPAAAPAAPPPAPAPAPIA